MIININNSNAIGSTLTVSTSPYAIVVVSNGNKTRTKMSNDLGIATFRLSDGEWEVSVSKDGLTGTETVNIQKDTSITVVVNSIPEFTYSVSAADGGFVICDENNNDITSDPKTNGDWKIKFLKSGSLTIERINGAADGVDVFCVGGGGKGGDEGGGGGAGGFAVTKKGIELFTAHTYEIIVGGPGGITEAFDLTANPGSNAYGYTGGDGGSGGGATGRDGGSDGSDGDNWTAEAQAFGGKGQASISGYDPTTKEFGETDGEPYAGGGGGAYLAAAMAPRQGMGGAGGGGNGSATNGGTGSNGAPNTGGGGGGGAVGGLGGSGIVIIRNKR